MRLAQPFYRLNVRFDADRLRAELAAMPGTAWSDHPNDIAGNSSVRLISVDGGANDSVDGPMAMTPHLIQSPYLRQVLGSFGVVWGRSRLMRLAPGAGVPQHADINYHWFSRVRIHIPIVTRSEVRFYCGDQSVHMAAGEAWLFDNWRQHRVENPTSDERIHLVADTSGSSSFWQFVARSQSSRADPVKHAFDAGRVVTPLTEHATLAPVMRPAEVDQLIMDLRSELEAADDSRQTAERCPIYDALLDNFCKDWRQLYLLYGEQPSGRGEFVKLRDSVRSASRELGAGIVARTNRVSAHSVLEGRVLRPMLPDDRALPPSGARAPGRRRENSPQEHPIFIVAAPRSGSTLLFETLAASGDLVSLGGEGHELVEGLEALRPGAPGVDSNRLTAEHCTPEIAEQIRIEIGRRLVDRNGVLVAPSDRRQFLEKTPKNSLRIPFFNQIFPKARFVFLWRDPHSNISSIMEAWRSGNWKTYNGLDGFDGPWSLLLPPEWRMMNRRPLEEIAAHQWSTSNRIALADLRALQSDRWVAVTYADLVARPAATVARLCQFLDIPVDHALQARLAAALPLSRHTQTAPDAEKWRKNSALIDRIMPSVQATWADLKTIQSI